MVAWVVACEALRKFGGDTIDEVKFAASNHRARVARRLER
jgi:hypothetical protein